MTTVSQLRSGLPATEAAERLAADGPNALPSARRTPRWCCCYARWCTSSPCCCGARPCWR
ncbi:cation-transporting P-type ATPase [Nonomuraea sp. 10N515B]|uniref:cation-transporting P-type ATPase n=1 Tax=Nonomuraea sp. 10N515B TaxID=3457422 RepID=UPI003FCE0F0A